VLAVCAALLVTSIPPAAARNFDDKQVIAVQTLLAVSGMREQLGQIPISTATSFDNVIENGSLPALLRALPQGDLKAAVVEAFNKDRFEKKVTRAVLTSLSLVETTEMVGWYTSSLGKRIRDAEVSNSLLTSPAEFEAYQQQLQEQPPTLPRAKLAAELDRTMKTTESAVEMMTNIQIAFNISLGSALPEDQQLEAETIIQMANQNKEQLRQSYRRNTRELLLFTYDDFTDAELRVLNKTLRSAAGQSFIAAMNKGISAAMLDASLALGSRLSELLRDQQAGPGL